MKPRLSELKIIGYGLILLYTTSFVIYLQYLRLPDFEPYARGLLLLNAVLLLSALGVTQLKDWGRKLIVLGNIAAGASLLFLYSRFSDFIPLSYIFMSIIVALFFSQNQMRNRFTLGLKSAWKCILVVDDDDGVIKTIRPILMTNGYSVLTAQTGEDGLQIARVQQPDMIILDVILPGIKGRDVCKKLKTDPKTKNIPVVFLTAKESQDDIEAEKEAGGISHLTKPVNAKELLSIISDLIGVSAK